MKVLLLEKAALVRVGIPVSSWKGLLQKKNLLHSHFGSLSFHVIEFICGSTMMPYAT